MKKTIKKVGICLVLASLISIGSAPAFASEDSPGHEGDEEYVEVPSSEEYQDVDGESDDVVVEEEEGEYEYTNDPEQDQCIEENTEDSDIIYEDEGEVVVEGDFIEGEDVEGEYIEGEHEAADTEPDQDAPIEELEELPGIGELEVPSGE